MAAFEVSGNGNLDVGEHDAPGMAIGSLEGDGYVYLGSNQLTVGSNNLSTTFSGVVQEDGGLTEGTDGSLSKIGAGTLTLNGISLYTGGTTVEEGVLLVKTGKGSATGRGPVQLNGGTFGGRSNITGAVTIGSGSGTGAYLAPGINGPGVLSIHNSLTFNSDGSYLCDLNVNKSKADQVSCKGATLAPGAQFALRPTGNQTLPAGTVFTVINNRSRQSISGTFSNLPDNSTLSAGGNNLQVSYQGGDGNDLTLTVTP